jgi:tetratricopeptide (TPR) repeat protein
MVAMEKFDKILELLEKNSLTPVEKQLLEEFSESDEEIKSFIVMYRSLNNSLSTSEHINPDLLASYILFEMGDESNNKLILSIRQKIKSHLDKCTICKNDYNELVKEYYEIQKHVSNSVVRTSQFSSTDKKFFISTIIKQSTTFRYAFATLAVFVVAYFGLFIVSTSITPDFKKNIFANEQDDFYKTRGRTSPLFQQGLNAIEKGDYSKAIEFLSEDIKEHQNEKSIFYTNYIIGITYLKAAESGFIGLFKSYDKNQVNLAITNLKKSIDKNNSGDYESLKLDAYYYMGRACLLNDERDSAITNFQKVIDGKGRYSKESAQLISDLEKN